jgi:WD40 repeat protein
LKTEERALRLVGAIDCLQGAHLWLQGDRVGLLEGRDFSRDWLWEVSTGRSLFPLSGPTRAARFFSLPSQELLAVLPPGRPYELLAAGVSVSHSPLLDSLVWRNPLLADRLPSRQTFWNHSDLILSTSIRRRLSVCPEEDVLGYTPDGNYVIGSDHINQVRIVDCRNGRSAEFRASLYNDLVWQWYAPDSNSAFAISADSRRFAIHADEGIAVVQIPEGKIVGRKYMSSVTALAFGPHGLLAAGTEDGVVVLEGDALQVRAQVGGLGPVLGVAFDPEGRRLAVGTEEQIRVYQLDPP